jgi:uncharacterized protein
VASADLTGDEPRRKPRRSRAKAEGSEEPKAEGSEEPKAEGSEEPKAPRPRRRPASRKDDAAPPEEKPAGGAPGKATGKTPGKATSKRSSTSSSGAAARGATGASGRRATAKQGASTRAGQGAARSRSKARSDGKGATITLTLPSFGLRQWLRHLLWGPTTLVLLALLVTGGMGYATTLLKTDASAGLLMDTGAGGYADQVRFADLFGADPVVVLVQPAKGQQLLTPEHMVGMAQLEGELSKQHGVSKVYGPGTIVNTLASAATQQALALCARQGTTAEQQARAQAKAQGKSDSDQQAAGQAAFTAAVQQCAQALANRYPNLASPALNNPAFYKELLLEPNGQTPRPFWKAVLPTSGSALISVRMDRNASLSDVEGVTRKVAAATGGPKKQTMTDSQGQSVQVATMAANLTGLRITSSGTPALMADLAESVRSTLTFLLPAALVAMLVLTLLVLRGVAYRLLAVPLAVIAGVWTTGAAALLGLPLTPATLAVLPVVLGLTTDYVLQAANRLAEEEGEAPARVRSTMRAMLPATGVAAAATAAGLLTFALSPVPLVRQFGFFLALGVAMSWLVALLVGFPVLRMLAGGIPRQRSAPSWDLLARAARLPAPALIPLVLIGLAGWAALPFIKVQTDPLQLLPPRSPALSQAQYVSHQVGSAGELDLVVTGPDVTDPKVVAWLGATEQKLQGGDLKPITGFPDFLLQYNFNRPPDVATTKNILASLPPYLTQAVVSKDHKVAIVAFGQRKVTSVAEDQALVNRVTAAAATPPQGYHAYVAGLSVVAANAYDRLTQEQVLLNVAALGVVLVVLLIAFRRPLPAMLSVLPTAVAAGWVTGAAYLAHVQTSPITILLSGVVVAFATEFSVLWLFRYRAEREAGMEAIAAAETACRRVGPAIVAAAAALAAGFAALAVSSVPMVRDFGLWCAADLVLATLAVLLLLPVAARSVLR